MADSDKADFSDALRRILRVTPNEVKAEDRKWKQERENPDTDRKRGR